MQWFSFDYILDQSEIDIKVSVEKFLLDKGRIYFAARFFRFFIATTTHAIPFYLPKK